jgi:hypothetical protein
METPETPAQEAPKPEVSKDFFRRRAFISVDKELIKNRPMDVIKAFDGLLVLEATSTLSSPEIDYLVCGDCLPARKANDPSFLALELYENEAVLRTSSGRVVRQWPI